MQADSAEAVSESSSEPAQELSYGETTLKISQLKAQIHRLESRLDSTSESSSDEEQDVRSGWLSAKADNLTAEVLRLQTENADVQTKHTTALQVGTTSCAINHWLRIGHKFSLLCCSSKMMEAYLSST